MDSREVLRFLEKDGWRHIGSHWQFIHPFKTGRVTVPHPKKDIPIGTLNNIEKQAGFRFRDRNK